MFTDWCTTIPSSEPSVASIMNAISVSLTTLTATASGHNITILMDAMHTKIEFMLIFNAIYDGEGEFKGSQA